ncbi:MAG: VWA domain-containing protein [Polyangiaceae bacterium]
MASSKSKASSAAAGAAAAPAPPPVASGPLTFDKYQRWRLILGKRVEDQMSSSRCAGGAGQKGESTLDGQQSEMDGALGAIYDVEESEPEQQGRRSAGLGKGRPKVSTWLGDVRKYFERDVVAVIQQDAIEKKGWNQLLFEEESLAQVTPSVELVGTLMEMKGLIPEKAKEAARAIVQAVVEEIKKRMQAEIERAVRGALDRSRHQPIPSLPNMDWRRTITANLKNYIPERRTIIPDHFFFYSRQQRRKEWNVIVCMDQSGSMADSVVYGSVMGCILASIPAIETHVVVFDTEVVDLTPVLTDPVEVIFGVNLGGGTDIHRAVKYCQGLMTTPSKTLFILLTDLIEGGDQSQLVQRLGDMASNGVRAMVLLALNDSGVPCYDENLAKRITNVGVPCFACTPTVLPNMLEAVLKGRDLGAVAAQFDTRKREK